jgi:hypothetical protein
MASFFEDNETIEAYLRLRNVLKMMVDAHKEWLGRRGAPSLMRAYKCLNCVVRDMPF